jgi:2-phospho-L-lactate/phosphoenolpyruvate guanylyltransferase
MTSPSVTAPPTALVPLRSGGKTRLGSHLDDGQRAALAAAMLADVCSALRRGGVERIIVAARGRPAVAAAHRLGVEVLVDDPRAVDLDGALAAAGDRLVATDGLLVVAADLPRLDAADVRLIVQQDAEVVVAPTADGGTGGLLRRPPDAIASAYGPGSAERHRSLAEAAGVRCATVELPGFSFDVDTVGDLASLRRGDVGPATARVLDGLDPVTSAVG